MSEARTLILLNEKRVKQSEPWNSTRGIYADFADGFDKPKYYCKCPKCKFVHGFYKTPREAIVRKLCNLCRFKDIEKLKKEVHQVAFGESEDIDPTDEINRLTDWEGYLRKLGFVLDPKDDTWRLEYTFTDPSKVQRRYQMEIMPNTPGYVSVDVSQWRGQAYWRTGSTDWVETLDLPNYLRRHYPWMLKRVSESLVAHLLA